MGLKPLNATGSVGEALQIKDSQGYDQFLSQVISENNTYRLFFYTVDMPEDSSYAINGRSILGAAYGGRNCDPKAVKCSFLPLTNFTRDEFGQLKDCSEMGKYARIASILHEAKYRYAVQQAENEAKKLAEDNGEQVDTVSLADKKRTLDQEYHGATINNVNVPPLYAPVIRGTSVFTFVSAILVKLNPDGSPAKDRAGITRIALNISKKKAQELDECLRKLSPEQLNRPYIEVQYAYNGKDKKEAGQNAHFEYVQDDAQLSSKYPEWWKSKGPIIEDMFIKDAEGIGTKNRNVADPLDEYEVILNFKKYIANNRALCGYMDFEAQNVKNAAEDLLSIDTIRSLQKCKVKLDEIVAEKKASAVEEEATDVAEETGDLNSQQLEKVAEMQGAGTLADIVEAAGGMDGFGELSSEDMPEQL